MGGMGLGSCAVPAGAETPLPPSILPPLHHLSHRVAQIHCTHHHPAQHAFRLAVAEAFAVGKDDLVPPVEVEVEGRARELDDGVVVRFEDPAPAVGDPGVVNAVCRMKSEGERG